MPSTAEAETSERSEAERAARERALEVGISAALRRLSADGLVAYPTETVWGLGARAQSEPALAALRRFKGRRESRPISILVCGAADLAPLGFELGANAERLMQAFWPGPLTLVMPCARARFAAGVARPTDGAVGVRCSSHPVAFALAREALRNGLGPITATSLNRSGEDPVTSRVEALRLCGDAAGSPTVLPAGAPGDAGAAPSTVVDVCQSRPRVLRAGAIERRAIENLVGPLAEEEEQE